MGAKGSFHAVYVVPDAAEIATASFSWSNAGFLMPDVASTSMNSVPCFTLLGYQKRSLLPIQFGVPGMFTTSPCALVRRDWPR